MATSISRKDLERYTVTLFHEGRSFAQCDISEVRLGDERYVLKDYAKRNTLLRNTWGRYIVRKEYRIYKKLKGIRGIPHVVCLVDDYGFLMDFLDAERLPKLKDNFLVPEVFDKLNTLVDQMHQRGISHGDLRRKNILVDKRDMQPYLIDFATAFTLRHPGNPISSSVFSHLCKIDRITVAKLKNHYLPESITEEERQMLAATPFYLRFGRFLKKRIYRPLKRRNRKKFFKRFRK